MLRFFTIIFALSISLEAYSQQYWLKQDSPTTRNFFNCFFTDTLNGWACGDSGIIIHTSDAGQSWVVQETGLTDPVVCLFFFDKDRGCGLSWKIDTAAPYYYGTRILSTTNGGDTWSNYLSPDSNVFFTSITFTDSLNGHRAGSNGTLQYTSDGGLNWHKGTIDSGLVLTFPVEELKFYDSNNGFGVGGAFDIAGVIWKTTNAGRSWRTKIVGPEPLNDIYIIDSMNSIAAGGDFEYGSSTVITDDAGGKWDYTELGIFGIANSIVFRTETEAWISLGIVDSFLVSTNSGYNWRRVPTPSQSRIYRTTFIDPEHGWAFGIGGVILKFNASVIGIEDDFISLPESFVLHQNYPNPFNPSTLIYYELKNSAHVELTIYDVTGKVIEQLFKGKQQPGIHKVKWNAENFPAGVYFCRLRADEFSVSRKMILIK